MSDTTIPNDARRLASNFNVLTEIDTPLAKEKVTFRMQEPLLSPFRGVFYNDPQGRTAPPYDVISESQADELRSQDPHNIVNIDLPTAVDVKTAQPLASTDSAGEQQDPATDDTEAHAKAAGLLDDWIQSDIMSVDDEDSFYMYRQGYSDAKNRQHQCSGVIGALDVTSSRIMAHEEITPKAASDRLISLSETQTNISMIYVLSLSEDLPHVLDPEGPPRLAVTDEDDVHHRIWSLQSQARMEAVAAAIDSAPLIIADGHHRFSVAKQYWQEMGNAAPPAARRIMAYVVPLNREYLTVRPIHRILSGLPIGAGNYSPPALQERLEEVAHVRPADDVKTITDRPDGPHEITILAAGAAWTLTPKWRDDDLRALAQVPEQLKSLPVTWLNNVLIPFLQADGVTYEHDASSVVTQVADSTVDAPKIGVLLPAITVDDIARVAKAGLRMPAKTTFFWPKARTGLVLRRFTDQEA